MIIDIKVETLSGIFRNVAEDFVMCNGKYV